MQFDQEMPSHRYSQQRKHFCLQDALLREGYQDMLRQLGFSLLAAALSKGSRCTRNLTPLPSTVPRHFPGEVTDCEVPLTVNGVNATRLRLTANEGGGSTLLSVTTGTSGFGTVSFLGGEQR